MSGHPEGPLLEVQNLNVVFGTGPRAVRALNGVNFSVDPGEIVGLVGESGCGKSVTTQCVMRLLPSSGRIVEGDVRFHGESLLSKSQREMRQIRGRSISLVLQDALAALSPVLTVGEQIADIVEAHTGARRRAAMEKALEMFRRVGIPQARDRLRRFPHELSGGMQQRTLIAGALILKPSLIIADEPTTALDVSIQAQILELLREIREQTGAAILYITHDLATVAELCDRVVVMYAGEVVESTDVVSVFSRPSHPYTQGLMASVPPLQGEQPTRLPAIPGAPPDPTHLPAGCRFAPRCALRERLGKPETCTSEHPALELVETNHLARCHFADKAWTGQPEARGA